MTDYTAWLDYVYPRAPGAGDLLVKQAIREALIEFCRRTLLYTHEPAAIDIVGLTPTYAVSVPATTVMCDIVHAVVNGTDIDAHGDDWLDSHIKDWRTTATGPARAYQIPDTNQVRIFPTPSESITGGLVVKCAVAPLDTSSECPDWLFHDWRRAIESGALAYLYDMPKKPWTSGPLYTDRRSDFDSWIHAGALRAAAGRTRARARASTFY